MKPEGDSKTISSIIRKLNYGYKSLSHMKWVSSASGFPIAVAGVFGLAGLVLALIKERKFFGNLSGLPWLAQGENNRLEKLHLVPGLQNLGNNCFLNVILQV